MKRIFSLFIITLILLINSYQCYKVKANWFDDTWKAVVDGGEFIFEKLSDATEFVGQTGSLVLNSMGALIKWDLSDLENGAKDYLESLLYIGGYYTKQEVKVMTESELLAAINKYFSANFQVKGANIIIPDIFVDSTVKYVNELRSKEIDYYRISVKTYNYKTELLNSSNYDTGEQCNFAKSLLESSEYSVVYYYTTYKPKLTNTDNFNDVTSLFNNKDYYPVINYGTYGSEIYFYDINWNRKDIIKFDYRNGINSSNYYRLFTSDGRYITVFKNIELFKEWTIKKGINNVYITNEFNNYNYNNDNSITINKDTFTTNNWKEINNNYYNNVNETVTNYYNENSTIIDTESIENILNNIYELLQEILNKEPEPSPTTTPDKPTVELDESFLEKIGNKIGGAIEGTFSKLFIPRENYFDNKINEVKGHFGFADSVIATVEVFQKYLKADEFKEPPILKIDITKYGGKYVTGEIVYVDLKWYEPYKPTVDNLLTGIIYLVFAWNVFTRLPSIISGAGAIVNIGAKISKRDGEE